MPFLNNYGGLCYLDLGSMESWEGAASHAARQEHWLIVCGALTNANAGGEFLVSVSPLVECGGIACRGRPLHLAVHAAASMCLACYVLSSYEAA